MIIDCDSCAVRDLECGDCVVTALLGGPPGELDEAESAALEVLADSGLVSPLRLVPLEVLARADPDGEPGARPAAAAG